MRLEQSQVELPTPTGPMRTYLYRPVADPGRPLTGDPGRFPGLVLFSEIYQRTGPIHRMAATMAGHGLLVVVPEIFHELEPPGTVLPYDAEGTASGNHHKVAKPISAYDSDSRAAVDHLVSRPDCDGRIGAMGVCIGGHLAFRCALDPRVQAALCIYATDIHKGTLGLGGDDSLSRAGEIKGELMMIWGRQDPHIPFEGRAKIQAALSANDLCFTWHELSGAHAFMRDEGPRHDPALALLVYRMGLDLLGRMPTQTSPPDPLSHAAVVNFVARERGSAGESRS